MKKKIFTIILTILIIIPTVMFAFVDGIGDFGEPKAPEGLEEPVENILGVIQYAGYAISIGMVIYIGIKYMMSAANEKAELKQASINYVIGAIVIAGASTIFGWCLEIFGEEPKTPKAYSDFETAPYNDRGREKGTDYGGPKSTKDYIDNNFTNQF